jgi:hypothetical protein
VVSNGMGKVYVNAAAIEATIEEKKKMLLV